MKIENTCRNHRVLWCVIIGCLLSTSFLAAFCTIARMIFGDIGHLKEVTRATVMVVYATLIVYNLFRLKQKEEEVRSMFSSVGRLMPDGLRVAITLFMICFLGDVVSSGAARSLDWKVLTLIFPAWSIVVLFYGPVMGFRAMMAPNLTKVD